MHCETCARLTQAVEAALARLKDSGALVEASESPDAVLIQEVERRRVEYAEARRQLEDHLKMHEGPGVIH